MTGLSMLFANRDGGHLSGNDTAIIDLALSKASSPDIPDDQVENVVDYLNVTLLNNQSNLTAEQIEAMETLLLALEARR
ncbi:hypothetical protein Cthiooxydans_46860 [Comamonas thiooxydans]|uniref:hypothetical protein n=1 Tax=Comamonas thiooxydans TaxID=363952 RepID=UPI001E58B96D|nr:hypothetical protein [Comamonas thiooxydans]BDB72274.1 hypothetical protein Cthiooxydans_46860 [Comamonas thiooxydans]